MQQRIPITAAGAEKLKAELDELKRVKRPAVVQAIAEAREKGDLSENAEYDAAKEMQGHIEGRIAELEGKIPALQIIDPKTLQAGDRIVFGATVELEEKESWLNNNLHKLMIGVSAIWFAIVLIYITQFFGWDNLFLMMPDEFGGFLAGITLPLAIIWVVMAYIDRGTSFKQEAKFLRAYMNQLVYPEEGAPQTAKAMADAIRSQVVELQEVSKMATIQTAKIKDEIKENINEFTKLVAILDNYSSKTIVELSDGVKFLTQNFETITDKARNSAETFSGLNKAFASGALEIEDSLENLFEKLLPKIKEIKTSAEFLHEISDASNHDIIHANEMLRQFNEETTANLNMVGEALNAQSQTLQQISAAAVTNCVSLKKTMSAEVENMADTLGEHTEKLEKIISESGQVMRSKIDDLSKRALANIETINERVNKGLDGLDDSVSLQIKKVDDSMSKHGHDLMELISGMDEHANNITKKLTEHGTILSQELDKLMVRGSNLEDSIAIQISNLNNVSDQAIKAMQKIDDELESNIDSLQNKTLVANGDLTTYVKSIEEKTGTLQKLATEAMDQAKSVGEDLQVRRQAIKETIAEFTSQIVSLNGEIDAVSNNLKKNSEEAISAMSSAADNMDRHATALNETTSVVVAQNQVSEASLAQQHKNITSSIAKVEEIKAELKLQIEELSNASTALENNASAAVDNLKDNLSSMLVSCNEVINKSRAINDNLTEQANQFDTSANRTLAKVTQFENVLNTQNQNIDLLSQTVLERVTNIDSILSKQNKEINEATSSALESFKKAANDFEEQSKALHEISRSATEYTSNVAAGLDEKAAALNTLFKQQENEFYNFCDKIADNAESMSEALKAQVGIIEQSADKVFTRMTMLEEDTSRHTEAVVNNSHRSIDRLSEIEAMVESKNASVKKMVEDIADNLGSISNKILDQVNIFNGAAKKLDEQGKESAQSLSESCNKLQTAGGELSKAGANVGKLLNEHTKNIDLAIAKVKNQSADINKVLSSQAEALTEVSNTLATQSRLGEASLAQQYKYLSDAAVNVAQKMKEVNDSFKSNTDGIFDTSTKLAYEFDVLGDRLIKAGEDVNKTSKNSMKNLDQVNLLLSQTGEDLGLAVKQSVEKMEGIFKEYEKYTSGFNTVTAETSTSVMEINKLIAAQSDKMITISDDTKKLVDCFNTVLSDTSNQLAERANQAYDKVKGLGKDLKNLGLQMEDAAKVSSAHLVNSGDKLRASISEIAANAERISNDILGSGEVFLKQSNALVAATDDTVAKVNSAMGSLLETSKDFSLNSDNIVKETLRFNETINNQIKELNEQTHKANNTLKNLTTAYQGIQIEGFLKQAGTIIEKLESISIDINRVFNPKDEEDLWKKFYNGDTAVFVRYLAKNMSKSQISAVKKEYEKNEDFRTQVNAYLSEFELLISAAKSHEHSGLLLSVVSGADIGKLYYILAKTLDKME